SDSWPSPLPPTSTSVPVSSTRWPPRWGLLDFVPTDLTREEALSAAAAVPAEGLRSYYFWGTPDDVVDRLRGFRAAGREHVDLVNVSALGDPAVAPTAAARTVEIMHGLRALP